MCIFFPNEYILTTVSSTEREQQPKKKNIHSLWLGGLCMPVYLSVWVWGKMTEERTAQEVLKFKILLANFGSGGWGCLWN